VILVMSSDLFPLRQIAITGLIASLTCRLISRNEFAFNLIVQTNLSTHSKLKFIVSTSITEGCNNSMLLLGPRGSGKAAVCRTLLPSTLYLRHWRLISSFISKNGLISGLGSRCR